MRMKRIGAGVVAISLLLGASAAQAATVVAVGDTAIRIENLDVGGQLYNVDFLWTSAEAIYGAPPEPIFDLSEAEDARDAVLNALTAFNADNPVQDPDAVVVGPNEANFFLIGFEATLAGTRILTISGRYTGLNDEPPEQWFAGPPIVLASGGEISYADFNVVPVPAAVWLFGSALGMLGWLRRKTARCR